MAHNASKRDKFFSVFKGKSKEGNEQSSNTSASGEISRPSPEAAAVPSTNSGPLEPLRSQPQQISNPLLIALEPGLEVAARHVHEDRGDPYGLKPLAGPTDEDAGLDSQDLDIIAVHGIDGNAWDTWEHKNGKLWLRDFLPKNVPGARIYSFGYRAEVAFTRGRGDLKGFARSLLEGVNGVRYGKQAQIRPIIFVCHSMGGLVVKQALITASLDRDDYGQIRDSTRAVLFLSTPHRGSTIVPWPKLLSNIGNVALTYTKTSGWLGEFRTDLLKMLERDSQELVNITIDFRNQHKGIKIISFYEGDATPPFKEPVVDVATGVLGFEGETIVPMDGCDHHTVCRFPSESSSYKLVLGHIRRLVPDRQFKPKELEEEEKAFLQSLSFSNMDSRHINIHRPLLDTCRWLFDQPSYQRWACREAISENHGILWLKGKPGSGKSTIMKQAVQEAMGEQKNRHIIFLQFYFFARGKDELERGPTGMYRSLLHQLLSKIQYISPDFLSNYTAKRTTKVDWQWELAEVQEMFFQALRQQGSDISIRVYIDALDECKEEEVRDVVSELYTAANDAISEGRDLRFCFSSRHYPTIRIAHCEELSMENHNGPDLTKYVTSKVEEMYPKLNSVIEEKKLKDLLILKSSNVFLWVSLVVRKLLAARQRGASPQKLIEIVKEVPDDLTNLFEKLFESIMDPRDRLETLQLLQWVVFATRTLTTVELRHAIAFSGSQPPSSVESWHKSSSYTEPGDQFNYTLVHRSRGLVEVVPIKYTADVQLGVWRYGMVQLIHASAEDFLKRGGGFQLLDSSLQNNLTGRSHNMLLKTCIAYIAADEVRFRSKSSQSHWRYPDAYFNSDEDSISRNTSCDNTTTSKSSLPFLDYATTSIIVHAKSAEGDGIIQDSLPERSMDINVETFQAWCRLYQRPVVFIHQSILQSLETVPADIGLLYAVCLFNLAGSAKALLNAGINVNASAGKYGCALIAACREDRTEIATFLLQDYGANSNCMDAGRSTPLHFVAGRGSLSTARLLLSCKAEINVWNHQGRTPLYEACASGNLAMMNWLLDNGASVNLETQPASNVLTAAIASRKQEVIDAIFQHNPSLDIEDESSDYGTPLCACCFESDEKTLKLLVSKGADPWNPSARRSILNIAAYKHRLNDIVLTMAENGLLTPENIDNRDREGRTFLHWAVSDRFDNLVTFLLEHRANPDILDGAGETPLHIAAGNDSLDICYQLISLGKADVNIKTSKQQLAHELAERLRSKCTATFLNSLNTRSESGTEHSLMVKLAYDVAKAMKESKPERSSYESRERSIYKGPNVDNTNE